MSDNLTDEESILQQHPIVVKERDDLKTKVDNLNATIQERDDSLATAQASVDSANQERDKAKADLETAQQTIATLNEEKTRLEGRVSELEASQASFDEAVSAKVREMGISPSATSGSGGNPEGEKLSLTEQCLAANGK